MKISPRLNLPQAQFLSLEKKFRLFVGGFGSGKTWVGCSATCKHFMEHPRVPTGYFGPSYPQIRDIFYPTIEEVAHDWGMTVQIKTGDKEVDFYLGGRYRGTAICRSMDAPNSIVGFKIGHAHVDEIDVMPQQRAELAWMKILARMRIKVDGLANRVDATTTPEGFRFAYDRFVKKVQGRQSLSALYGVVRAATYANAKNLPGDYIPSLLASYPPQLIAAYLRGEFTNLTSGSVYPSFCREANNTLETDDGEEPLEIGMDFNVLNMSAVVHIRRLGCPIAVNEFTKVRDTPEMIAAIQQRYPGRRITVYPDASGKNTSSKSASVSDITLLKAAGFKVWKLAEDGANPLIKDRVMAMNAAFLNQDGVRRYRVNVLRCPNYAEALEKQPYASSGLPDKAGGFDHLTDAGGYFIWAVYPIKRRYVIPGGKYLNETQPQPAPAPARPQQQPAAEPQRKPLNLDWFGAPAPSPG